MPKSFTVFFILKCRGLIIPLLLVFFYSAPLFAQERSVRKERQQGFQYINESKISDKWTWLIDGGYRWKESLPKSSQYTIRSAIGYSIHPNIRVASGFAHQGYYSNNEVNKIEFRPYQEVSIKNQYNSIGFSHKFRAEERFFKHINNEEVQSPTSFNYRFRYSLMASISLINLSSSDPERKLLLNFGDEIFLRAGEEVHHNTFEQNRLIISPSLQYDKNLTFSLTWNRQFGSTPIPNEYKLSHVFWLQVKHKLDFRGDTR